MMCYVGQQAYCPGEVLFSIGDRRARGKVGGEESVNNVNLTVNCFSLHWVVSLEP